MNFKTYKLNIFLLRKNKILFFGKWGIVLLSLFVFSCNSTKYVKKGDYLLDSYTIELDNTKQVNIDDLHLFVKQKPNTKFFEVYPFYLNVFYNMIDPKKEAEREKRRAKKEAEMNHKRDLKGKPPRSKFFVTRWIRDIGEAPVIYDGNLTVGTKKEFKKYLVNRGFYYSKINDTVIYKDKKAKLTYTVKTGKPYIIKNVDYKFPNAEIANLMTKKIPDLPLKEGRFFDIDSMQSQRMYMSEYLKNNGYYFFQKEYIYFEADTTVGNYNADLKIRLQKQLTKGKNDSIYRIDHQRFSIGEIKMYTDFDAKSALFDSESYFSDLNHENFEGLDFYYKKKRKNFHPRVLTRGLKIYEDSIFSLSKTKQTRGYLSSLGVFKTVNISFEPKKGEDNKDLLDCNMQLTPGIPQSYKIELEASVSGGWRTEAGINYKHLNLFKSATTLDLNLTTALEKISNIPSEEGRIFNNEKYGVEADITIPKFLSPFKLTKFNRKYLPRTNISLKYDYQRRFDYTRSVINAGYGYFWKSSTFVSHSIRLADLYSTTIPSMNSTYLFYLFETNNFGRYFDHFILGSSYSYLFSDKKGSKRENFNFFKFDVEWAGNLLYAAHKLINKELTKGSDIYAPVIPTFVEILKDEPEYTGKTQEQIEAELSADFDDNNSVYTINKLDYKQYIKTGIDFHQTFFLEGQKSWAYRVAGGVIVPYGNSNTAPVIKQYYVGGANSIRGWSPRQIGPGGHLSEFDADGDLVFFESYGDIILEANAEFRFNIWWMFYGAIFADAGNVWLIDTDNSGQTEAAQSSYFDFGNFYNQFAVNTGFGLRMDMDFFIMRFDIGVPLFDPRLPEGGRWVWGQSRKIFKRPNLTFGIGLPF